MNSTEQLADVYRAIVHWGIPALCLSGLHYLAKIATSLSRVEKSLAVVVVQIEGHSEKLADHAERIGRLERNC